MQKEIKLNTYEELCSSLTNYRYLIYQDCEGWLHTNADSISIDGNIPYKPQIFDEDSYPGFYGYTSLKALEKDLVENLDNMNLSDGGDDRYFDYNPAQFNASMLALYTLQQNKVDIEFYCERFLTRIYDWISHSVTENGYYQLSDEPSDLYFSAINQLREQNIIPSDWTGYLAINHYKQFCKI